MKDKDTKILEEAYNNINFKEKLAFAIRTTQTETGIKLDPSNMIIVWNDCPYDSILGFRIMEGNNSPTIIVDNISKYFKAVRMFEELMQ